MTSQLKEAFAHLGPIRAEGRVRSGSRAVLVLRPGPDLDVIQTVSAIVTLSKRGLSHLKAKRAVEEALDAKRAVVQLPDVESLADLAAELTEHGFRASFVARGTSDVREIRAGLGLSQEQFAIRYGLDVNTIQNWEAGRRQPDQATRSYLKVIQRFPEQASEALEE